jgi:hypothetical protein
VLFRSLTFRAAIINKMISEKIFNYFDVWEIIKTYYYKGKEGLPWPV